MWVSKTEDPEWTSHAVPLFSFITANQALEHNSLAVVLQKYVFLHYNTQILFSVKRVGGDSHWEDLTWIEVDHGRYLESNSVYLF